jgi:hypothetical protein
MRKTFVVGTIWAAVCVGISGAGVWDTKPYAEWSDKDLEKVMEDSPWAGKGSLTHAREGANLGTVPEWDLIVAVRSALPFKQALVRRQIGFKGTPTSEHEAMLSASEEFYTVSLGRLPRSLTPMLQKVADGAEIRRRGKEPIKPINGALMWFDRKGVQVADAAPSTPRILLAAQRGGGFGGGFGQDNSGVTGTLVLGFPKTNPITAADNEFDFVTTVGNYNVRRTFKLKDMIFKGQLAL